MSNPAETYEREMVPVLFAPWAPLLFALAAPQPGEQVLDLACGTGIVARQAAPWVGADGRIVGLDLNPGMLAVAGAAAAREGLTIEWQEGRMEALPFADGEFDLVLCQHGLQFSPERPQAVTEMRRVLRDGGRVGIAAWQGLELHSFWATFNEALNRHLGIPALAAPFSLASSEELHGLLADAGFREIVIEPRSMPVVFRNPDSFIAMEVDVIAAAIPAAQHLDAEARAALTASISAEMAGPIREQLRDGRISIPMHAHLARAMR